MVLSSIDYSGIAIPTVINGNSYLPLSAIIEELGHTTVKFAVLIKDGESAVIERKGFMNDNGIINIQIDKNKILFRVSNGHMTFAKGEKR